MLSKPNWILFLSTIKIFKDYENVLANVTLSYSTLIVIRFNARGALLYKRLMGMCRWMGSHFYDWRDYKLL